MKTVGMIAAGLGRLVGLALFALSLVFGTLLDECQGDSHFQACVDQGAGEAEIPLDPAEFEVTKTTAKGVLPRGARGSHSRLSSIAHVRAPTRVALRGPVQKPCMGPSFPPSVSLPLIC